MATKDPRIDAYIARAQPFAQPILTKVRERVHAVVPDVEEAMKWSHPTYCRNGKIILGTAAFKEQLRAADLLFFSDRSDKRVTHVGIALGERRMVHLALGRGRHLGLPGVRRRRGVA